MIRLFFVLRDELVDAVVDGLLDGVHVVVDGSPLLLLLLLLVRRVLVLRLKKIKNKRFSMISTFEWSKINFNVERFSFLILTGKRKCIFFFSFSKFVYSKYLTCCCWGIGKTLADAPCWSKRLNWPPKVLKFEIWQTKRKKISAFLYQETFD